MFDILFVVGCALYGPLDLSYDEPDYKEHIRQLGGRVTERVMQNGDVNVIVWLDKRSFLKEAMISASKLNSLALLDLSDIQVTPTTFGPISKHNSLSTISMDACVIEKGSMAPLADLPRLIQLSFSRVERCEEVAGYELGKFKKLKLLSIANCKIVNNSIDQLASIKSLQDLSIIKCRIDDDIACNLTKCQALTHLTLTDCIGGDKTAMSLGKMPALKYLNLSNTRLTDKGLERIIEIRDLQKVEVSDTLVTKSCIERLRKEHPKIDIQTNNPK